jgi:TonB family protein
MTLFPRSYSAAFLSLVLAILLCSVFTNTSFSQSQAAGKRHLVAQSQPKYPSLARTLRLEGVVRLEVVVSPEGSVKSVGIKGGHPVLADAAASTVREWKWERAPQESHEIIEVRFTRPD